MFSPVGRATRNIEWPVYFHNFISLCLLTAVVPCGTVCAVDTQQVRLKQVPQDTVRKAKSEAALRGMTLDAYLTEVLVLALHKEKRGTNGKR